ncbi:MAG: diaminopimelate epimerase [Alphaproteobacteria bacterium]|nr:MAG: diaminopimelate epimerase [Alphaproteobacteria bacterium]
MHGLGNDFVIFDGRMDSLDLTGDQARHIADRRRGIGCDQVITMLPSAKADIFMRIQNVDGSEAGACGNATRCVGDILLREKGSDRVTIATGAGLLVVYRDGDLIRVDMGMPLRDWQQIPLSQPMDTDHLDVTVGPLSDPVAVNMGNPHVVFFVDNIDDILLAELGPQIERHPLFPDRVNVSIIEDRGNGHLRQRVWERGVGITDACGSGACAGVVAASTRGLVNRCATIELDGGILQLVWGADNHVQMTGGVSYVYDGKISLDQIS